MTRLTATDLLDPATTITVGTPATKWLGYTSSGYKAVITKVEHFKSGDRAGCIKAVEACQVNIHGNVVPSPTRHTVRPNGELREVGDTYGWNTLHIGEAVSTPYWD
jgi:hypothetical protein